MSRKTIAALFVQVDGCYADVPYIDVWDEVRDAKTYQGDLPVVAHPPCQLWGSLAYVNYSRWGKDKNRPGNDAGCFEAALRAVEEWGGVLEHPAFSRAFRRYGLAVPQGSEWQRTITGGYVCEVWQSAYGHKANKRTWLYYRGVRPPFELRWNRPIGTHQVGMPSRHAKNKPSLSHREANATPIEFRDELLRLARNSVI